jgi:large subunit ribosomal protein L15
MELHSLKPASGSSKNNKRRGRGRATGSGGTAGRGHKGHKARSGNHNKRNFEGGQMPLQMRIPKHGFRNKARVEYVVLNLDQLQGYADKHKWTAVSAATLVSEGLLHKDEKIKILGRGEVKSKLDLSVHACSETAKKAIEAKGGSVTLI